MAELRRSQIQAFLTPEPQRWQSWVAKAVCCAWLYLALLAVATVMLHATADRGWLGTLVLFGPRWVFAVPLAVLLPAARRVRGLVALAAAGLLFLFPLADFRVPWRAWVGGGDDGRLAVRVLTCNCDGPALDVAALARVVAETRPDVVALQEWDSADGPVVFADPGWHVDQAEGTGLFSRLPIRRVGTVPWNGLGDVAGVMAHYELTTPHGPVQFFNVHLPTPREGLQEMVDSPWRGRIGVGANTDARWRACLKAAAWIEPAGGPVIIAGDFNMPVESAIYCECFGRYVDAFSVAGLGFGNTKFTRWHGVRIDHVLAGPEWGCRRCRVGPDVRSDHRPLIADLHWVGTSD